MRSRNRSQTAAFGRHRFSLRILLLVIAGFAALFAYLSYFRSAQASVEYAFLTVETADLDSRALSLNDIAGSPYRWTHLSDSDLEELLTVSGDASTRTLEGQASIHSWPLQAETCIATRLVFLEVSDPCQGEYPAPLPMFERATFNGFLGVRMSGRRLQFRLDAEVNYDRPDDDVEPRDMSHPMDKVHGRLFYEGQSPEHALMFAAPLDDHTHQVILFTVKRRAGTDGHGATESVGL